MRVLARSERRLSILHPGGLFGREPGIAARIVSASVVSGPASAEPRRQASGTVRLHPLDIARAMGAAADGIAVITER